MSEWLPREISVNEELVSAFNVRQGDVISIDFGSKPSLLRRFNAMIHRRKLPLYGTKYYVAEEVVDHAGIKAYKLKEQK